MSKPTITRVFIGSVVAIVAGFVLGLVALLFAFGSGSLVMTGPDVTGIEPTAIAWTMVGLFVLAIVAVVGGAIGGLVAWIGALLNTANLDDKTWFIVLLVLGISASGSSR